jgi:PKD repeat protein
MNGRQGLRRARVILPVGSLIVAGAVLAVLARNGQAPGGKAAPAPALQGFMGAGATGEELPYAPGRLLVQVRAGVLDPKVAAVPLEKGRSLAGTKLGVESLDALAQGRGVIAISKPYDTLRAQDKAADAGVDRWYRFDFQGVENLPKLADEFADLPEVESVSLDWRAWPQDAPTDPLYAANWGHDNRGQLPAYNATLTHAHTGAPAGTAGFDADVPAAWQLPQGQGAAGVVIGIIDGGVDLDHPDLRLVAGYDFGDDDANPDDDATGAGHGTCCAGIAAALANGIGAVGVAPGCSVMPLKVADSDGIMYFSAVQQALYYAADHGVAVVSLSLGAPIKTDAATEAALRYADAAGVVLVASTGNGNLSEISYPASSVYVIAVGAASPGGDRKRSSSLATELNHGVVADPNGCTCDGEMWWGSSYGSAVPDALDAVDLLAPTILPTCDVAGAGGLQPDDVEPWFNGTSCAAPYVAGVAALVRSAHPDFTPAQVRAALVDGARDVNGGESAAGWDRYSGYGLVNALAALGGQAPVEPAVAPVADFTADTAGGPAPLTVQFTDASTGAPTAWQWDFGDGATSTQQSPSHVYATAGSYDVVLTVIGAGGSDVLTQAAAVTVTAAAAAPVAALAQNEPNPFNPVTRIAFTLPRAGHVRLVVYNPRGQEVARLAEGTFEAGTHTVTWDASDQPSGLYIYRLVGPGLDEKRKMTLVK